MRSKYELIALVDDDDEWSQSKLEKQFIVFKRSKMNIGLIYTWANTLNDEKKIIHRYRAKIEGKALKKILKENPAAYINLVSKPRFVCLNCGRVANSKKNLCKPENMKK